MGHGAFDTPETAMHQAAKPKHPCKMPFSSLQNQSSLYNDDGDDYNRVRRLLARV